MKQRKLWNNQLKRKVQDTLDEDLRILQKQMRRMSIYGRGRSLAPARIKHRRQLFAEIGDV